jgi:hypothetical protein
MGLGENGCYQIKHSAEMGYSPNWGPDMLYQIRTESHPSSDSWYHCRPESG